jgi:hypothetical protein
MPALPPTPSMSSPKVTSSLANTEVLALGLKKFTPADTLAPQVVLEDESGSGRDQRRLIVVGEIAPQAADDERLHGGAGP